MLKLVRKSGTIRFKYSTLAEGEKSCTKHQFGDAEQSEWKTAIDFENIPGPRPISVLGSFWRALPGIRRLYGLSPDASNELMRKKYGDIIIYRSLMGNKPMVVLYNPNDMEKLLRSCEPLPHRYMLEAYVEHRNILKKDFFKGAKGLVTTNGSEWYKVRTLVNPILLQAAIVDQNVLKTEKTAVKLVDNMRYFAKLSEKNEMPKKFSDTIFKWSLESICHMVLDRDIGSLDRNSTEESKKLMKAILDNSKLAFYIKMLAELNKIFHLPLRAKFIENFDFITGVCSKYIDESLESPTANKAGLLHQLATCDPSLAKVMAIDMIIAGTDTTGLMLSSLLYLLAKNPEKQEILREEISIRFTERDSPITIKVLNEMPYLKAVIKESMRIASPLIGTMRNTTKDSVIGGYRIPADTNVIALHSFASRKLFKEPEKFIPERWLRTTIDEYSYRKVHPFAYMPFGFGTRSCIGKRIALMELQVAVLKIIQNFKLSWRYPDMRFSGFIFQGPAEPLTLTVEEISA